uniref:Uncharacterized protein n=1 Tax=Rhizophora mucronata TaxID=61149 RepID=A0A2P2LYY5_RHIMU
MFSSSKSRAYCIHFAARICTLIISIFILLLYPTPHPRGHAQYHVLLIVFLLQEDEMCIPF